MYRRKTIELQASFDRDVTVRSKVGKLNVCRGK